MQRPSDTGKIIRKSDIVFAFVALLLLLVVATQGHAYYGRLQSLPALEMKQAMVEELGLTDLCLFTEARYTRHLSQADLHTAFQDHPLSLEHFPSGSLLAPPQQLTRPHENLVP
jgi:hypothetical protein